MSPKVQSTDDDWFDNEEPALPQFKEWAINHVLEEWNDRTWYGRLWYPFWLLGQVVIVLSISLIVFMMTGEPLRTIFELKVAPAIARLARVWDRITPSKYREDASREST